MAKLLITFLVIEEHRNWISAHSWTLLCVVTIPWHLDGWQFLSIKKKYQHSQKKLWQNGRKKEDGRFHFWQYSDYGFNWLARMEKSCLYIIISILFLNNNLAVAFFFSLLMWPVA